MRFLSLFLLVLFSASPSFALEGEIRKTLIESPHLPAPVEIAVYTPPGFDPARNDPYPLIVQLHGGNGSADNLYQMATILESAVAAGLIEPAVSVMPSAGRSLYMNYRDGSQKWESFITDDLLSHMRLNYPVTKTREKTLITGVSMGGMGALRIAFRRPDLFAGVAAMEPGIEPALTYGDIMPRDRFWRNQDLFERIFGDPVDEAYWADNNPATIASRDPEALRSLGIYLEAGDQDMFYLHHGTEFLHRILFDAGVSHEYRLVRGADHVGPSLIPRTLDALGFLGRVLSPPVWVNEQVRTARRGVDVMKQASGYPVTAVEAGAIRTQ
jgi:S-formylglutathione hydrolase